MVGLLELSDICLYSKGLNRSCYKCLGWPLWLRKCGKTHYKCKPLLGILQLDAVTSQTDVISFHSEHKRKLWITLAPIPDIFRLLIRFPSGEKEVSLLHNIQQGSRADQRLPLARSPEAKWPRREGDLHQVARLRIRGCTPINLARFPMFTSVPPSVCRN